MKLRVFVLPLLIVCLLIGACKKKKPLGPAEETPAAPQLSTSPITVISDEAAIGGGAITANGSTPITEAGICWDTLPGPDLNKGVKVKATSLGNYTCAISGLKPFTKYYVKAYAINSNGTAFGSEISFTSADVWKRQYLTPAPQIAPNCMKALGDKLYAGTNSGVLFSPDGGDTWQAIGLQGFNVVAVGVSNTFVFAALSDQSIHRTNDNGQTWTQVRTATSAPFVMDILVDEQAIYRSEYNGIYLSTDNGVNWVNKFPSVASPYQCSRLMKSSGVIYTPSDTYTSLYKTSDQAASWQSTADLNFGAGQFFPDIDYAENAILFGTYKGLYTSIDEGSTWTKYDQLPAAPTLISVSGKVVFSATDNSSDLNISYDKGNTWSAFSKKGFSTTSLSVSDVLICSKSIFIFSGTQKILYRYRR